MSVRATTWFLILLLVTTLGQLWVGRGSVGHVHELNARLSELVRDNARLQHDIGQTEREIADLQSGGALLETLARQELGMAHPGEVVVKYRAQ